MYLKIMSITFTLYNGQRWMEIDGEAERRIGRNDSNIGLDEMEMKREMILVSCVH